MVKQGVKMENETIFVEKNGNKSLHFSYLGIYSVILLNSVVFFIRSQTFEEYELFFASFVFIIGGVGIVKELFFKVYKETISFDEIKNIRKTWSIFHFIRPVIKICYKNKKIQYIYTDSENSRLLLALKDRFK